MKTQIITSMVILSSIGLSNADDQPKLLADFKSEQTSMQWRTVNDGVMGGRSKGDSYITEASRMLFKGKISLENNGGFSSVRSYGDTYDMTGYDGVELKLKGDGRKYYFTIRCKQRGRVAFWSPIQPKADEWVTLRVPFESFYATSFGRKIPGKLDMENITSFGFMLYDKNDGNFSLEVESIKAYQSES